MQLFTIAAMLVAACGVIFALQNSVPVSVAFLLWSFDSSLALVLLLALAVGGFIVALVSTPSTLRRQWAVTRLNRRIAELEQTVSAQAAAIANLQSQLPASETAVAQAEPSYVGLKQIIANRGCNKDDLPPPV